MDGARPIIYHTRAVTCAQPQVKGLTIMVDGRYNGWRIEHVWLATSGNPTFGQGPVRQVPLLLG